MVLHDWPRNPGPPATFVATSWHGIVVADDPPPLLVDLLFSATPPCATARTRAVLSRTDRQPEAWNPPLSKLKTPESS